MEGERYLAIVRATPEQLEAIETSGAEVVNKAELGHRLSILALHNSIVHEQNPPRQLTEAEMINLSRH